MNYKFKIRSGQAMLVAILIITASALSIGLAVATVSSTEVKIGVNSRSSSQAYFLAENCLENTLMRFARGEFNPPTGFTDSVGSCTIEITGASPYQIISKAQVGRARSHITATVNVGNEVLDIVSYQELY